MKLVEKILKTVVKELKDVDLENERNDIVIKVNSRKFIFDPKGKLIGESCEVGEINS